MLVVYVQDTLEIVYLNDAIIEIPTEIEIMLKKIYGENTIFNSFVETKISYSDFANLRDNNLADFGVEIIDSLPQFTIVKKISVTTDQPQILADGIDTVTITAQVDNPTSTELIELWLGETLVDSQNAINGVAIFQITMTQTDILELTVKSTTKYGQANITIEGVA